MEGGKPMSVGEKSYIIQGSGTGFHGGRYRSKTGAFAAAKKAGARLYRNLSESQIKLRENKGKTDIKFILKESTKGSTNETFTFSVTRVTLAKPVIRMIAGNKIVSKYTYEVKKCNPDAKLE